MESEQLSAAIKKIAWAYVLLHLNFYLGTLNILPNWLGYILILQALPQISQMEESAALLRPLGILLALWEGLLWGAQLFSLQLKLELVNYLATAISLYFHFQLLTNLAHIAEACHYPKKQRLLHLRTVRTLLITLLVLPVPWQSHWVLTAAIIAANLIVAVWICDVLFSLKAALLAEELAQPAIQEERSL